MTAAKRQVNGNDKKKTLLQDIMKATLSSIIGQNDKKLAKIYIFSGVDWLLIFYNDEKKNSEKVYFLGKGNRTSMNKY